ncbi:MULTISPECIES: hypothetical protein [unclassified Serratia (in: enterobacteria)]|uniref:hypothetical protein n=1 Tax=unclassified Serratia (in: enterobacteria) TaxID=2647522 RepID=UPI0012E02F72|nr:MULTISPECIES: hypothetical protein [unclassified Serratia (in: enterobacteria)]
MLIETLRLLALYAAQYESVPFGPPVLQALFYLGRTLSRIGNKQAKNEQQHNCLFLKT